MQDRFEMRQNPPRREGTASAKPPRVRPEPRISLHAMAEYLTAAAGRRRTIVTEQKRPKDFQVIYYREAEPAIARFLASGGKDQRPLEEALRKLGGSGPRKPWEVQRCETGTEAIKELREWAKVGRLDLRALRLGAERPRALTVGHVEISVRPEILVVEEDGMIVGCAKLYLSKSAPLSEERARYSGTILHQYLESLGAGHRADWRQCSVLDVFRRRVWNASRTYPRRRQDVVAACNEIEGLWPKL